MAYPIANSINNAQLIKYLSIFVSISIFSMNSNQKERLSKENDAESRGKIEGHMKSLYTNSLEDDEPTAIAYKKAVS